MSGRPWRWVIGCVSVVALVSCGGGDDDATDDEPVSTEAADTTDDGGDGGDGAETSVESDDGDGASDDTVATTAAAVEEVNILTDFGDVCRGVSLPGATAYDPARPGVHPVVAVAGEAPEFESSLTDLPDTWDPVTGEEQTVELVACLSRTSATETQLCEGYENDDGTDSGQSVQLYDATYDVTLVAATTGEVVASTSLEATETECPFFVFFDEGETVKPWYAEPTDALTAFLSPHVET